MFLLLQLISIKYDVKCTITGFCGFCTSSLVDRSEIQRGFRLEYLSGYTHFLYVHLEVVKYFFFFHVCMYVCVSLSNYLDTMSTILLQKSDRPSIISQ